jgi:GntR family transcriptional regulator, transcriptional repressor for pyruvate dehydrogenase complex
MPFNTITPPPRMRLSDVVCAQLEKHIVEGKLKPGEALPPERELASRLGVSRPSLREALLKLEARGIVQVRRGGGFAVNDVTAPTITDPLIHLLYLYPQAAEDVLEMRHGLEAVAASLAALRATPANLKKLKAAFVKLDGARARADPLTQADADAEFHLVIAEASHNVALMHVTRGIFNLMRRSVHHSRYALLEEQAENRALLHEQHEAILEAIIAHDPDAARTAAHLHLNFILATLREMNRKAARGKVPVAADDRLRATKRRAGKAAAPAEKRNATSKRRRRTGSSLGRR